MVTIGLAKSKGVNPGKKNLEWSQIDSILLAAFNISLASSFGRPCTNHPGSSFLFGHTERGILTAGQLRSSIHLTQATALEGKLELCFGVEPTKEMTVTSFISASYVPPSTLPVLLQSVQH